MKKFHKIKKLNITGKKRFAGIFLCAVAVCFGLVAWTGTGIKDVKSVLTSSQTPQIQEHDGDVLVDSAEVIDDGAAEDDAAEDDAQKSENNQEDSNSDETVTTDADTDDSNSDEYFKELRASVDLDRNEVIAMLTDTIESAETQSEKSNATDQKLKIIKYMEQEKNIESNITSKRLPQSFVLISDNSVNITVDKQELKQQDVAQICEIVIRETGRPASEIVVQSRY